MEVIGGRSKRTKGKEKLIHEYFKVLYAKMSEKKILVARFFQVFSVVSTLIKMFP